MVIGPGGVQGSDFLVTSMITDRIGRLEVLLPINHNYDKIWKTKFERQKKLDIGCTVLLKKNQQQLTRRNVRQQRAHVTRSVHLRRYDVLTVPHTSYYTFQLEAWHVHCSIGA